MNFLRQLAVLAFFLPCLAMSLGQAFPSSSQTIKLSGASNSAATTFTPFNTTVATPLFNIKAVNRANASNPWAVQPLFHLLEHPTTKALTDFFDIRYVVQNLSYAMKAFVNEMSLGIEWIFSVHHAAIEPTPTQPVWTRTCSLSSAVPGPIAELNLGNLAQSTTGTTLARVNRPSPSKVSETHSTKRANDHDDESAGSLFFVTMCIVFYIYATSRHRIAQFVSSCAHSYAMLNCHAVLIYAGQKEQLKLEYVPTDSADANIFDSADANIFDFDALAIGDQIEMLSAWTKIDFTGNYAALALCPGSPTDHLDTDRTSDEVLALEFSNDFLSGLGIQAPPTDAGFIAMDKLEKASTQMQGCDDSQISIENLFELDSRADACECVSEGKDEQQNDEITDEIADSRTAMLSPEQSPEPDAHPFADCHDSDSQLDSAESTPQPTTPATTYEPIDHKASESEPFAPSHASSDVRSAPRTAPEAGLCELLAKAYMSGVIDTDPTDFYKTYLGDHQLESCWTPLLSSSSDAASFILQSNLLVFDLSGTITWCLSWLQDVMGGLDVLVSFEKRFVEPDRQRASSIRDRIESFEQDTWVKIEKEIEMGYGELKTGVAKVEAMMGATGRLSKRDRLLHFRSIGHVADSIKKCLELRGEINAGIVEEALILLQEYQYAAESLRERAQTDPRVLDDFLTALSK